jgi:hypothetical protein
MKGGGCDEMGCGGDDLNSNENFSFKKKMLKHPASASK